MKTATKIISVVVVILLLACIAGTLAAFTNGYKNWDVKTWFKANEAAEEVDYSNYYVVDNFKMVDGGYIAPIVLDDAGIELPKKDITVLINGKETKLTYSKFNTAEEGEDPVYMEFYSTAGKVETEEEADALYDNFYENDSFDDVIVYNCFDDMGDYFQEEFELESAPEYMVMVEYPTIKVAFEKKSK